MVEARALRLFVRERVATVRLGAARWLPLWLRSKARPDLLLL